MKTLIALVLLAVGVTLWIKYDFILGVPFMFWASAVSDDSPSSDSCSPEF